ncbi:MAG TPA: hypothetical protein VHV32_13250, partial [Candidatus Angelobacter sp.]|nr:hypothetical protein [Candidatus Angelobacter sp.]
LLAVSLWISGILALIVQRHRSGSRPKANGQKPLFTLTFLTTPKNLDYYPHSMHASRFTFAFTYRYRFTGSGHADLC